MVKPKNYEHIIWDWNGTILDDGWLCADIANVMLTRRGLPETNLKRYREEFVFPVIDYYKKIGVDFDREQFADIAREFAVEYEKQRFDCSLREGVREVIQKFRAWGARQYILSAYQQTELERSVAHFGIRDFFESVNGLSHFNVDCKLAVGKALMDSLAEPRGSVLLIGDTTHDASVAEEIGADCLLVAGGHQNEMRLITCNATMVHSHIEIADMFN